MENTHTLNLSLAELKEEVERKRVEREQKLTQELNAWLKDNDCILTTSIPIHINGQAVGVSLRAL